MIMDNKKVRRLSTVFRNLTLEEALGIVVDSFYQEKKGIYLLYDPVLKSFSVVVSDGYTVYTK